MAVAVEHCVGSQIHSPEDQAELNPAGCQSLVLAMIADAINEYRKGNSRAEWYLFGCGGSRRPALDRDAWLIGLDPALIREKLREESR